MQCKVRKSAFLLLFFILTCNVMQGWDDHAMYHEVGEQNEQNDIIR
jgi:hypothetical protein